MRNPPSFAADDRMSAIYDCDTAVHYFHTTTGINVEACWSFLRAVDRYQLGMGFIRVDDDEALEFYETTQAALRDKYPACFRPRDIAEHVMQPGLLRLFIALDAGLDESVIRRLQIANDEYMTKLGLLIEVAQHDEVNPAPSGPSLLLTEWVTIRGTSFSTPWVQDAETWLDVANFSDADLWIDISDVPDPTCRKKD